MRGLTIQKRVSSTSRSVALRVICAVTTTPFLSLPSVIVWTVPMSTFLYLILVLPASRPSAVLNSMSIVGPCVRNAWKTRYSPTSTATIGMIQTSEICRRLRRVTCAFGMPSIGGGEPGGPGGGGGGPGGGAGGPFAPAGDGPGSLKSG